MPTSTMTAYSLYGPGNGPQLVSYIGEGRALGDTVEASWWIQGSPPIRLPLCPPVSLDDLTAFADCAGASIDRLPAPHATGI